MRAISLGDRLLVSVLNQIGDALKRGRMRCSGPGAGRDEREAGPDPHTRPPPARPCHPPRPLSPASHCGPPRPLSPASHRGPPRLLSPASRGPPGAGPSTTLHRPFPGVVSQGLWELSSGTERTHPPSLLSSRPHVCLVETRLLSSGPRPSLSNPHNEKTLLIPPLAPLPRFRRLQTPLLLD